MAGGDSLELAPCQNFACQTFARLLKCSFRYEWPDCFNLDAIRCYLLVFGRNEMKKIAML